MYTPKAFAIDDLQQLQQQILGTRLALLVTHGEQGLQASHLPLLLNTQEGPYGTLYGHFAKANAQWKELQSGAEALVIFAGADAYVSPGFYPSKAEHGKAVPTWNYVAVHAYGTGEVFTEADRLLSLVSALTDRHEASRTQPWKVADAPPITSMACSRPSSASPYPSSAWKASASSARTAAPQTSPAYVKGWRPAPTRMTRHSPS